MKQKKDKKMLEKKVSQGIKFFSRYLVVGISVVVIALLSILNPFVINEGPSQLGQPTLLSDAYAEVLPTRIKRAVPPPEISAESALVVDRESGRYIYHKRIDEPRPLASITKLMTMLVLLDRAVDWSTVYEITEADRVTAEGSQAGLRLREKVMLDDLFKAALVVSANDAVLALVHSQGWAEEEFSAFMNLKAKALGLPATFFVEPTGLDSDNRAPATAVAKILDLALAQEKIASVLSLPDYEFVSESGFKHSLINTNRLVGVSESLITAGKTGFLPKSGYNFVGQARGPAGQELIVVILGSNSINSRLAEAEALVQWVVENYVWQ